MSFDEFYELYPRKVKKGHAENMYVRAIKKVTHETLMTGLRNWVVYWRTNKTEMIHIPHPGSWLNPKNKSWDSDEIKGLGETLKETAYCKAFKIRWELRQPPDWRAMGEGVERAWLADWDQSIHGPRPASVGALRRMYRIDQWQE